MKISSRTAALSTILGGFAMIPIQYLWLLSHGLTGYDERNLVFGLLQHDYERLSIVPLLLVLPGLRSMHLWQRDDYGQLGMAGYRLTLGGYIFLVIGLITGLLFGYSDARTILGAGIVFGLFGGLLIFIGWLVWGIVSARAKTLVGWKLIMPFYMGLAFLAWFSDPTVYGLNPDTLRVFLHGLGFIVLGSWLLSWEAGDERQMEAAS